MKKILIVGGGTGGHFYPAFTLSIMIKKRFPEKKIIFILGKKRVEDNFYALIPNYINKKRIEGAYFSIKRLPTIFKSLFQSFKIIIEEKPDCIILFGGYLSLFIGIIGKFYSKKIIIHEQNAIPGKVSKILSFISNNIWLTFETSKRYFHQRANITGIPIREQIKDFIFEKDISINIPHGKKIILFLGGSQGAEFINDLFFSLIQDEDWKKDYFSILISGNKCERTIKNSHAITFKYCENMSYLYNISDFVISRAGASTLAEITYFKLRGILIPYPYAYRNHQYYNAKEIEKHTKAFVTLSQDKCSPEIVKKYTLKLLNEKNNYKYSIVFDEKYLKEFSE